ncbi:hypothetical protein BRADI_1g13905v3 [Brachypodium distachyon]|uniref:Uncharacterized protein n=1 Tax=Brachypodium distachyon TaxID=15368 RepID=A0A2K2DJD6_BRADI|nr:hypothetical protein BRADI_1g13905v3 [Brachypodium distachyon]
MGRENRLSQLLTKPRHFFVPPPCPRSRSRPRITSALDSSPSVMGYSLDLGPQASSPTICAFLLRFPPDVSASRTPRHHASREAALEGHHRQIHQQHVSASCRGGEEEEPTKGGGMGTWGEEMVGDRVLVARLAETRFESSRRKVLMNSGDDRLSLNNLSSSSSCSWSLVSLSDLFFCEFCLIPCVYGVPYYV